MSLCSRHTRRSFGPSSSPYYPHPLRSLNVTMTPQTMMMPFNCSYRIKSEPTATYPSLEKYIYIYIYKKKVDINLHAGPSSASIGGVGCNPRVTFDGKVRNLGPRDKCPRIRFPPPVFLSCICGRRGATQSDSSQFNRGSSWDVSRRYPDDAERVHVVLSREGGLTSLGLASQETVTQVSPEPRCRLGLPIRVGVDRHS